MKRRAERDMNDLTGVVLCGGQSSRMGRDKGLIERDGMVWAARVGRKLASLGMRVVYSVRAEQEAGYSAALPGAILIADASDIAGPLNGLFSVHRRYVDRDLLLLACDMQDMDEETIGELIRAYRCDRGFDCYVYEEGGFVQPFCCIYAGGWLERMRGEIREDRSLQSLIRKGRVRRLKVWRGEAFGNYNSM
jgi:molybdopterin-guanine dinucleotide biosynthesis protein A